MGKWAGYFSLFEKTLWSISVCGLILLYLFGSEQDILTLIASIVGATALIFLAKGNVTGQILTVVFSLLYGVISFRFHYYGEMITYLGMTGPIALFAAISWLRHPFEGQKSEVQIERLSCSKVVVLVLLSIVVTVMFYFILAYFHTANLWMSTVSVFTSFLASGLTFLRSPYYALAYAGNDIVLIVLWILATIAEPKYMPMILCFVIFLFNDMYGFVNWKKIQRRQQERVAMD
ncbi:MAG: nicotinamide mononucleotide transporter [Lachnospiraceae bacterium]|nr:nicotinamide mononucleotide transporter [Lachnospiraceae bacterium]